MADAGGPESQEGLKLIVFVPTPPPPEKWPRISRRVKRLCEHAWLEIVLESYYVSAVDQLAVRRAAEVDAVGVVGAASVVFC
jgi:hypothetical protein